MQLYRGVIEDNNHPDKNGKVKVRIFGIHTENNENNAETFENISTAQLPWAEVMGSNESGLISGVGISSVLKQGTWVWVILDNNDTNKPIVLGVVKGTQTNKTYYSSGEGFNDPSGVFPLNDRIGENDLNELSRGQIKNTVISYKNNNLDSSDYYSESAQTISEYPYNQVFESQSGHIIEIDDTPNKERVQIIDKNGNYIEMKVDEYIDKAVSKKINLIMSDLISHISGGVKEQIDLDYFKDIAGYFRIRADGNLEIINDVKISGSLQVTGQITSNSNITSKSQVADSVGNLSALRNAYASHSHSYSWSDGPGSGNTSSPPGYNQSRASDFTWQKTSLGFDS